MYTYYPYYNGSGWYRYPAAPSYNQVPYQQTFPQAYPANQGVVYGYENYNNGLYGYGYPSMNSYNYTGYTETGNANGSPSFNVGAMSKGVMNYFQNEEGQLDFDKMMSTTGQVMKTVQQVSPIVKGIGTFVKGIK
ncbi:YppG family protein [Halobacillus litoralis]|uniref:YppG family protein n=1 Tax=Halobacillus litoralis TaxID=45668 RepID=UPI001CFCCC7F|nr:YppG family protein [Halobacillus litoralis]